MTRYIVDRAAIDAEIQRRKAIREKGYFAWFTRVLFVNLLVLYAVTLLASPRNRAFGEMQAWRVALVVGLPFLAGLAASWISTRAVFKPDAIDAEKFAERVAREVQSLAGPGWAWRSLKWGVLLGLAIGVPVAALLAYVAPVAALPTGSRLLGAALFLGLTLLWAIPMTFLLRWWSLITYRRLLKQVDHTPRA